MNADHHEMSADPPYDVLCCAHHSQGKSLRPMNRRSRRVLRTVIVAVVFTAVSIVRFSLEQVEYYNQIQQRRPLTTNHKDDTVSTAATPTMLISNNATILIPQASPLEVSAVLPVTEATPVTSSQPPPPVEHSRWNGAQFLEFMTQDGGAFQNMNVIQNFPSPRDQAITLYSRKAWQLLRDKLEHSSTPIICSMGGSATSGGYLPRKKFDTHKWDHALVNMLQHTFSNLKIQLENRGHGGRTTFHSAYLLPSFLPATADLVIWEFALNDGNFDCEAANNALILFLNQLDQMQNKPLVVLAYFWSKGAFSDERIPQWNDNHIPNKVFDCHAHLAASYDFVVGSVNLAAYFSHLDSWDPWLLRHHFVANDGTHPNARGQWMMGYLLWDLIQDENRPEVNVPAVNSRPNLHTPCSFLDKSLTTNQKRLLEIMRSLPPKASWSSELPINDDKQQRADMQLNGLHYYHHRGSDRDYRFDQNFTVIDNGKNDPDRMDRKYSYLVPCCIQGEGLGFDISRMTTPPNKISVLQITHPGLSNELLQEHLHVEFLGNGSSSTVSGVNADAEWTWLPGDCKLETWSSLMLPENDTFVDFSRIHFCNKQPDCMLLAPGDGGASLMHLVVY